MRARKDLLRSFRLEAWSCADKSIQQDIGEVLGRSLEGAGDDSLVPNVVGTELPITVPVDRAEVRLTVAIATSIIPRLCEVCLGDPSAPEEAWRDVLRELANTAAGAFVRAAGEEGLTLTHGLPVDAQVDLCSQRGASCQRFALRSEDGELSVHFGLELLGRTLAEVAVASLVEGMVLARGLHTERGDLLVESGTRLTSSQIERVRGLLPGTLSCEVVGGRLPGVSRRTAPRR